MALEWVSSSALQQRHTGTGSVTYPQLPYLFWLIVLSSPFCRRYRLFAEKHGDPPPEFRLLIGQAGAILVSGSFFCIALTTFKGIHWIAPIIASVPFGTGAYFVITSSFSYLVVAYRPVAASAMASNSAMRATFTAVFRVPLFTDQVYHRLGIVGATALLAGIATLLAPLP